MPFQSSVGALIYRWTNFNTQKGERLYLKVNMRDEHWREQVEIISTVARYLIAVVAMFNWVLGL